MLVSSSQVAAATKFESTTWKAVVASSISLIYITNPLNADRMFFESGGGESVVVVRGGAQWDWRENILTFLGFDLSTILQVDFSSWQSTKDSTQEGANNSLGFNPIFRFERQIDKGVFYLDTSVGLALISSTQINSSDFGSNFQFSGLLGIGALLGNRLEWSVGYKFNHFSNNSISLPNNGINFHMISISYKY